MRGVAYEYGITYPYSYTDANGKTITEPMRMEEAATIGLGYEDHQDITENDIRKEHGLPLRGAYGKKK